jgi:O-antigen/teichoic acid export membrane protein
MQPKRLINPVHKSSGRFMTRGLVGLLRRWFPAMLLYASSTGSLMVGLIAQSVGLVVLARFLGIEQFGILMTITAVTNLGGQWCGLGAAEAMRRRTARDLSVYPLLLGHSLILILATGIVITILLTLGLMFFFDRLSDSPVHKLSIILILVPSNVILWNWIGLVEHIFLARWKFTLANAVNAGFGIARALAAVIACLGFGVQTLENWAIWHGTVHVAVSVACVAAIWTYGAPRWRVLLDELPLGTTLAGSYFLTSIRQNIDVMALSALTTPAIVGAYGVARRVLGAAIVSSGSLDRIIYSKLAIAGQRGPSATLPLAQRYVIYAALLSAATSVGLFIIAPLLPSIFGKDFGSAVEILRTLCWTLVFAAVQFIAVDALTAADEHRIRVVAGGIVTVLGAAILVVLTHAYGLHGTFVGVYLSEGFLAVVLWTLLISLSKVRSEERVGRGSMQDVT